MTRELCEKMTVCLDSLTSSDVPLCVLLDAVNDAANALRKAAAPKQQVASLAKKRTTSRIPRSKSMDQLGCTAEEILHAVSPFLVHETKTIRSAMLRLLRRLLDRIGMIEALRDNGIYMFVCRSLESQRSGGWERLESIKLIRETCTICPELLPRCCVMAVAALMRDKKDAFARAALDVFIEMAVLNPKVVVDCDTMYYLFEAALDFPYGGRDKRQEMEHNEKRQEAILAAIQYLVNENRNRCWIDVRSQLHTLLAPLIDPAHATHPEESFASIFWCCRAMVIMMRSWSGFLMLASEGCLAEVVKALTMPSIELKESVLDSLFLIIQAKLPDPGEDPFTVVTRTKTSGDTTRMVGADGRIELPPKTRRHNLVDNFTAATLLALIEAGVVEGLVELENQMRKEVAAGADQRHEHIAIKVTILLGELLSLSNTLLPSTQCARLQTLQELVNRSLSFSTDPQRRSRASTMVTNLHHFSQDTNIKGGNITALANTVTGANRFKRVRGQDRRLDRLDDVKRKIDWRMDTADFRQKMALSGVLSTKEHQKWNWDIIMDIVEGPLQNPALLQQALRTKFIKRLVSFLRPSNNAFSGMKREPENAKYTHIACQLLEILVSNEDGKAFLGSNPLLPQIGDLLRLEAEPKYGQVCKHERLFTVEKVLRTLTHDYFTIIGSLSSSKAGLDFLVKFKLFEYLPILCVMPQRHDLCTAIMTCVDYNLPFSPTRLVLQKALNSESSVVRFLATRHLQLLYRASVNGFHDWGVKFLVAKLGDEDGKVAKLALDVLDEAADDVDCLESLVTRNPNLLSNGLKGGKDLMMRFLTRRSGFQVLSNTDFIKAELRNWRKVEYLEYCAALERQLQQSFSIADRPPVTIPPHFFHNLAYTKQGCDVLEESKCLHEFAEMVRDTNRLSFYRRAALWVVGHIGRSVTGLRYIMGSSDCDIIPYIVKLSCSAKCLSLRGTCFLVLGLLSNTDDGREFLGEHGWESLDNNQVLVSVPKHVNDSGFFHVDSTYCTERPGKFPLVAGEYVINTGSEDDFDTFPKDPRAAALCHLRLVNNPIRAGKSWMALGELRKTNPDIFRDVNLFFAVMQMMEYSRPTLTSRRHIYELFAQCNPSSEDMRRLPSVLQEKKNKGKQSLG